MKKLIAALVLALLLPPASALGQSVGASQIRKKADAGLVADSANALAVGIYRGASAPGSPVTGQLWQDTSTTPATLKAWNGSAWEIPPTGSAVVQADLSSLPGSPYDGEIVWVSSLRRAIVYDSATTSWYYLDATDRKAVSSYDLSAHLSSAVLTPPSTAPTLAVGTGVSTAGSHVCAVTFYNSTGGETTPGPSSDPLTTTAVQGIDLTNIPTGGAGTVGRRVYCSEAGNSTPLFYAGTITDNTTAALTVSKSDAALLFSAPDANFSAPVPSGWTVRRPNSDDPTYGGCGSTGTTLLCASLAFVNGSSSATNGVRLTYEVTDGSGNWRATFKVVRAAAGFVGTQSIINYSNVFAIAASANNVDAPEMRGLGAYTTASGGINAWTDDDAPNRFARAVGGAWGNSVSASASVFRWVWSVPFWLAYQSDEAYSGRWGASANAKDWGWFLPDAPSPSVYLAHVGITAEEAYSLSTINGWVMEISNFTVEPW